MTNEHRPTDALIYVAGLPEDFWIELEQYSGNLTVPVTYLPFPRNRDHIETDRDLTLILFDCERLKDEKRHFFEKWTDILQKVACIAIYQKNRPDFQELSVFKGLRDVLPIAAVDRIAFAIKRELDTQLLSMELQHKNALLQELDRTRRILPDLDRQTQQRTDTEQSEFPTWILSQQEFIKYLDEHLYILNQNNHKILMQM